MSIKSKILSALAMLLAASYSVSALAVTEVHWWHAMGGGAIRGQRADGSDADQGDLLGQVVGGEDGQVGCRREARAEVAKVGVEQDGVVDEANQVASGSLQWDVDESGECVVGGGRWHFDFARAVNLADVVGVGVGFDKFADDHF